MIWTHQLGELDEAGRLGEVRQVEINLLGDGRVRRGLGFDLERVLGSLLLDASGVLAPVGSPLHRGRRRDGRVGRVWPRLGHCARLVVSSFEIIK